MDYKLILALHYTGGMSGLEIAQATEDGKTTVNEFLKRFRECAELSYPLPEEVTNEFIAERLYHRAGKSAKAEPYRDFDPEEVCRALTRKGETLKHLWKKYNAAGVVGSKRPLSYRQYCRRYQNWLGGRNVTIHVPRTHGVNLELDFAGKGLWLSDRHNPEKKTKVTVFVAALSYQGS